MGASGRPGQSAGKACWPRLSQACRAQGAVAVQMVHLASSPPQAAAIYERMGYALSESSFTKVI